MPACRAQRTRRRRHSRKERWHTIRTLTATIMDMTTGIAAIITASTPIIAANMVIIMEKIITATGTDTFYCKMNDRALGGYSPCPVILYMRLRRFSGCLSRRCCLRCWREEMYNN